jgi:NADH:quinone reductase (non-electrogenic)
MSATLADARPDEATAVVETPRPERKRVVIVGGGFAGLAAAHALRHAEAEVVLIDQRNHHIFQPLLYQVATAVLSPAEIAAPIRQLEVKQRNLSVLLVEVTGVSLADRTVDASCPGAGVRKVAFDFLVVATACARAISDTTSSLHMRRGSRTSATLRRSEPKSWARSNWPQRPRTRADVHDR